MCGRFAASASTEHLVSTFAIDQVDEAVPPTWNAAPTDPVPAVVDRAEDEAVVRRLVAPRWGLVPAWAKDDRGAARLINARVETAASKPSFRRAFAARRCLVPADGYYEWYPQPGGKQPYFLRPTSGGLLAMAGLYEFWRHPATAAWLLTCTILTTTAADSVGHIHDRMPVGVHPDAWADWLDPRLTDSDAVLALLRLDQPPLLEAYPVSSLVGNVRNDGPELVAPLEGRIS